MTTFQNNCTEIFNFFKSPKRSVACFKDKYIVQDYRKLSTTALFDAKKIFGECKTPVR